MGLCHLVIFNNSRAHSPKVTRTDARRASFPVNLLILDARTICVLAPLDRIGLRYVDPQTAEPNVTSGFMLINVLPKCSIRQQKHSKDSHIQLVPLRSSSIVPFVYHRNMSRDCLSVSGVCMLAAIAVRFEESAEPRTVSNSVEWHHKCIFSGC